MGEALVVIGGAGFVGSAIVAGARARGRTVVVLDRADPTAPVDLLAEDVALPPGEVVLACGRGPGSTVEPWEIALDLVLPIARLVPALHGRRVTLVSCALAPGTSAGSTDPMPAPSLPVPPMPAWLATGGARALAAGLDVGAAWDAAVARVERLVAEAAPTARILRFGWIYGPGREEEVAAAIRGAPGPGRRRARTPLAEVVAAVLDGSPFTTALTTPAALLAAEAPALAPLRAWIAAGGIEAPVPVVIPPRAARPEHVAAAQQESLWSGRLKGGNRWSTAFREALAAHLDVDPGVHAVHLTRSGTDALRLAVLATAGPARPGERAILPSFTFPATAEVLVQLGYGLQYVEVDPDTWNLCPAAVEAALARAPVRLVVAVDALGAPADYPALRTICAAAGAFLVGDSAASLGARSAGSPVGTQADAHAFSMSFAKALSAAGAGGAVVVPEGARLDPRAGWTRSVEMDELHAVAGLDQLTVLEARVRRRREIAARYEAAAAGLVPQRALPGDRHAYVHWVARCPDREGFAARLSALGIGTARWFGALHRSEAAPPSLPITERLADDVLALPMSSELSDAQVNRVLTALAGAR